MSSEQMIAEMFLEMKRLRAEVAEMKAIVSGQPLHAEGWADAHKAAAALQNEGVKNARHLKRLRLEGVFSEARAEIQNTSTGNRPTWEYHIPKCRQALQRHFRRLRSIS